MPPRGLVFSFSLVFSSAGAKKWLLNEITTYVAGPPPDVVAWLEKRSKRNPIGKGNFLHLQKKNPFKCNHRTSNSPPDGRNMRLLASSLVKFDSLSGKTNSALKMSSSVETTELVVFCRPEGPGIPSPGSISCRSCALGL